MYGTPRPDTPTAISDMSIRSGRSIRPTSHRKPSPSARAFATLPGHLRTDGAAILTLVRNLGSSIGISVVIAQLTDTTISMHARLTEFVTPFNNALQMPDAAMLSPLTETGRAIMDRLLTQQATIIAYIDDYKFLMIATLAVIPLLVVFKGRTDAPSDPHSTVAEI